jgi:hypothetical protein
MWPEQPTDPHLAEIRETLFSGLEHLPGYRDVRPWMLNPDAWRETPEYDDIQLYLADLRKRLPGA